MTSNYLVSRNNGLHDAPRDMTHLGVSIDDYITMERFWWRVGRATRDQELQLSLHKGSPPQSPPPPCAMRLWGQPIWRTGLWKSHASIRSSRLGLQLQNSHTLLFRVSVQAIDKSTQIQPWLPSSTTSSEAASPRPLRYLPVTLVSPPNLPWCLNWLHD